MALGIPEFTTQLAALQAHFAAGDLTQEALATALRALWEQYDSVLTLADNIQSLLAIKEAILDAYQAGIGLKGTVSAVSALPASAAEGDAWKIDNAADVKDKHLYVRISGAWVDLGFFGGEAGRSAYQVAVAHGYAGTEEEYAQDPIDKAVLAATSADEADAVRAATALVRDATDLVRTQTLTAKEQTEAATAAAQGVVDAAATLLAAKDTAVGAATTAGTAAAAALGSATDAATSAAAGKAAQLTYGEKLNPNTLGRELFNGATAINDGAGKPIGFTIPAGSTGHTSYVSPYIFLTADQAAALLGRTVRIRTRATVTAGFLAAKPLSANPVGVLFADDSNNNGLGTLVRSEQIGTTLYREALYTFTGNERRLVTALQVIASGNSTAADHSLTVVSTSMLLEAVPSSLATSPGDEMLASKLADFWTGKDADNKFALLTSTSGAALSTAIGGQLTIGEQVLVAPSGEAFNGASLTSSGGKITGITIPAGSTGHTSYVQAAINLTAAQATAWTGRTIRLRARVQLSAGFLTNKSIAVNPMGVTFADGSYNTAAGTLVKNELVGNILTREATYVMTGNERNVRQAFQIGLDSSTSGNHTLTMLSATLMLDAVPSDKATNPADDILPYRLEAFWTAKGIDGTLTGINSTISANAATAAMAAAANKITAGELTLANCSGQVFDGATAIVGPAGAGNLVGFNLAAGQAGYPSYVVANIAFTAGMRASLNGRTIRLKAVVALSAGFMAARALNAAPANVGPTSGGVRQGQGTLVRNEVIGNTLYREVTYTCVGDEATVGIVLQLSNSSGTAGAHSLQVTSLTYALETASPAKASTPNDEQLALVLDSFWNGKGVDASLSTLTASVAAKHFGFVNRLEEVTPAPQFFNGAVARVGADGRNWGWTIPNGQTGTTTLFQAVLGLQGLGALLTGRTVRVSFGCDTSANYSRVGSVAMQVNRGASDVGLSTTAVRNTQVSTNRRIIEFQAVMAGTEVTLKPYFTHGTWPATTADEYLVITDIVFEIVASPDDTISLQEENIRLGAALRAATMKTAYEAAIAASAASTLSSALSSGGYAVTKTVKADGTGDYTHPKDAVAAITDASLSKRYRVLIYPGTYTGQSNWSCKDYVDLIGTERDRCIIHYENPDSVDPTTISTFQTFWCNTETRLENLTVTIKNGRYPIHSDSSGSLKDRTQRVFNCHVEHLGNQGARDYQTANGGNPNLVWASEHAWGYGSSSNMTVLMDRSTTLKSQLSALYVHTRENFDKPSIMDVRNIRAVATRNSGTAVTVQPLGSRRNDQVLINNCELIGDIAYIPTPWIPSALADQPANHAEVSIVGAGNTPAVFTVIDFGRALKIESNDTTNSSAVAVSGSAVPLLFGEVYSKPGNGGIKGYVYGWADISGNGVGLAQNVFITALGKRLGDCTSANKVLSVSFQGSAAINITFDQDYTAVSNATILAAINTALGSAGVASEYAIGQRYRPSFLDEEKVLRNDSGVSLPMGSVLAYDADFRTVRLMTSADPASRFAGVAWEDIYSVFPNNSGRVKTRGYLPIGDILRTDSATFAFGDTFSIDPAAPGRILKGGSQGLFPAIRSTAVKVN